MDLAEQVQLIARIDSLPESTTVKNEAYRILRPHFEDLRAVLRVVPVESHPKVKRAFDADAQAKLLHVKDSLQ